MIRLLILSTVVYSWVTIISVNRFSLTLTFSVCFWYPAYCLLYCDYRACQFRSCKSPFVALHIFSSQLIIFISFASAVHPVECTVDFWTDVYQLGFFNLLSCRLLIVSFCSWLISNIIYTSVHKQNQEPCKCCYCHYACVHVILCDLILVFIYI